MSFPVILAETAGRTLRFACQTLAARRLKHGFVAQAPT